MRILITGSDGLVGGEAVSYFDSIGHEVYGADNNMRRKFFGPAGDTSWNRHRIFHSCKNYHPNDTDITNMADVWSLFHRGNGPYTVFKYDAIIHCAAQPSHDYATKNPDVDYRVNVEGTRNLLECAREFNPEVVFIFMSTNKVYDDAVNHFSVFDEYSTRFDFDPSHWEGFDERTPLGASNIFGSHKLEADKLVQKYAKDFGMKTIVLRGGCLTGPGHSGVELHGFLSYLVKCAVTDTMYKIYGYKGKQIRDNIHSYDVIRAIEEVIKNPRLGAVYNIGGGRENSISVLEAINKLETKLRKRMNTEYVDQARLGDHKCYISDMSKFKNHYPDWKITKSIDQTLDEMIQRAYWDDHSNDKHTLEYPLNEDSIVFDIGGYRGTWTADIVTKYNPNVYLFEPTVEFSKECRERFKNNPKVHVIKTALGKQQGLLILAKQGMNTSAFRGLSGQQELPTDRVLGAPVEEQVSVTDIHDELEFFNNIDLMSINCEAGEYDILNRMIETGDIRKIKHLQIQFHNFYPNAGLERDKIREKISLTHREVFCYPWVWESWKHRDQA